MKPTMLSLSQFKAKMLQIVRIMIETGMYVDVNYKDRAYRIIIEDLDQPLKRIRPKRSLKDKIATGRCEACGKLELNGVCMSTDCPRNQTRARRLAKK